MKDTVMKRHFRPAQTATTQHNAAQHISLWSLLPLMLRCCPGRTQLRLVQYCEVWFSIVLRLQQRQQHTAFAHLHSIYIRLDQIGLNLTKFHYLTQHITRDNPSHHYKPTRHHTSAAPGLALYAVRPHRPAPHRTAQPNAEVQLGTAIGIWALGVFWRCTLRGAMEEKAMEGNKREGKGRDLQFLPYLAQCIL